MDTSHVCGMSVTSTRTVLPSSGTQMAQSGTPENITRSASSTPSHDSSGSMGVRASAVSSASSRWISASCACRRRTKPTVLSSDHVHAGSSGSAAASAASSPPLAAR